jgi:hypothetical protein
LIRRGSVDCHCTRNCNRGRVDGCKIGLLKWKNDVGRGTGTNASSRGRIISRNGNAAVSLMCGDGFISVGIAIYLGVADVAIRLNISFSSHIKLSAFVFMYLYSQRFQRERVEICLSSSWETSGIEISDNPS